MFHFTLLSASSHILAWQFLQLHTYILISEVIKVGFVIHSGSSALCIFCVIGYYTLILLNVINTVMTALLECHQYTLIVLLQCIAIICQSINPDHFWKPIKLLRTHPVDAEMSNGNYRYLGKSYVYVYFGINIFSTSASDHNPLHVFKIQQEVAYICIHVTLHEIQCLYITILFQCNKQSNYIDILYSAKFHDGKVKWI